VKGSPIAAISGKGDWRHYQVYSQTLFKANINANDGPRVEYTRFATLDAPTSTHRLDKQTTGSGVKMKGSFLPEIEINRPLKKERTKGEEIVKKGRKRTEEMSNIGEMNRDTKIQTYSAQANSAKPRSAIQGDGTSHQYDFRPKAGAPFCH